MKPVVDVPRRHQIGFFGLVGVPLGYSPLVLEEDVEWNKKVRRGWMGESLEELNTFRPCGLDGEKGAVAT